MKKQIIASGIIISSLTNLTTNAMEQALVFNGQFDKLPKHQLNIIASFTKRAGKDTLRCVNKKLNKKIISQDVLLYAQYHEANQRKDHDTMNLLSRYNTFTPDIHAELIDMLLHDINIDSKKLRFILQKQPHCHTTQYFKKNLEYQSQ
jgi:hypothetical protein